MRIGWKEYLGGVREISEDGVSAEAISPYYAGIVRINSNDEIELGFYIKLNDGK